MSLSTIPKPDYLVSGERARLIPLSDTNKEGRITSSTLAAFMSVNEFSKGLLDSVGVRLGKASKVECFTEIVFRNKDRSASKIRPDGLIVVTRTRGKQQKWSALIEAKIGNANLENKQIESYLALAKEHKIDAVITISNQFTALPTHHLPTVKKNKIRSVSLFHWSWTYLTAEAVMRLNCHRVSNSDQVYILKELVRYLQHESSGVRSFDRMNSTWKDVCSSVQDRILLKKTSSGMLDSVDSWHQFICNISLNLNLAIGANTTIYLKTAHRDNPNKRRDDEVAQLANEKTLTAEFDIPDVASRIKLTADVATRSVTACMRLKAPKNRSTNKGRINWIVGQLKKINHPDIDIRAIWPGTTSDTIAPLATIREQGMEALLCDNRSLKLTAFEVVLKRDLGSKFKGAKTFIQETEPLLHKFYEKVGRHLKKRVAPSPKIKTKNTEALIENVEAIDDSNELSPTA